MFYSLTMKIKAFTSHGTSSEFFGSALKAGGIVAGFVRAQFERTCLKVNQPQMASNNVTVDVHKLVEIPFTRWNSTVSVFTLSNHHGMCIEPKWGWSDAVMHSPTLIQSHPGRLASYSLILPNDFYLWSIKATASSGRGVQEGCCFW